MRGMWAGLSSFVLAAEALCPVFSVEMRGKEILLTT